MVNRSDVILDRLLSAHAASFDIERHATFAGRAFAAHARFHSMATRYVLTKRAKLWGVNVFEHILFFQTEHLTTPLLHDLVSFMSTDALSEVQLVPDHMTTYLSLVIIADTSDAEAMHQASKTRFRKNFALGFKGWADLRLCVLDLSTDEVAANAMAKGLRQTVEANLF